MRLKLLIALVTLTCLVAPTRADAPPVKGRTLLMVDDHDILYRSGTQRFLNPAKRYSDRPLIAMDKKWEVGIAWTSIYRNPQTGKYQLWYQAYAGKRSGDERYKCVVCYAESDDGIHFTKPELDLFPYSKDFPKTNIVLIGSGGYGDRYCNAVQVDPDEKDPAKRYKMLYYDFEQMNGREENGGCAAFSPDGIHWTKHPGLIYKTAYGTRGIQPPYVDEDVFKEVRDKDGKLIRKSWAYESTLADAVDFFRDPRNGEYVIYAKMWMDSPIGGTSWKHGIGRSTSKDFIHWSEPEFIIGPGENDSSEAEFHTMPVFPYKDIYFGLCQVFVRRPIKLTIDVELMTSRDGYKWHRDYKKTPFIKRPEPGIFDSRSVFTNSTPIILDDEIRFYYGAANMVPLMKGVKSLPGELSGVGLATIPRDRFAGIKPVESSEQTTLKKPLKNIGQITLKPLDLKGVNAITLNADASNGAVRVEVLNEDGYRMRGFTKDDAKPITGDNLRHAVEWKGKKLGDLPAGNYMLRVHLDNATLYAIDFK
jgi:hypothetical protein